MIHIGELKNTTEANFSSDMDLRELKREQPISSTFETCSIIRM